MGEDESALDYYSELLGTVESKAGPEDLDSAIAYTSIGSHYNFHALS
jgi:hypothetical protein